jgi:hypothetical protein
LPCKKTGLICGGPPEVRPTNPRSEAQLCFVTLSQFVNRFQGLVSAGPRSLEE